MTTATEPAKAETEAKAAAAEPEPSEQAGAVEEGGEADPARCPICQFIEAGECGGAHKEWVACREEAKAAGKDYIDECQDKFKSFLQCAVTHRDYYEPFLEMLGGVPDPDEEDEEAAAAAGGGGGGGGEAGEGQGKPGAAAGAAAATAPALGAAGGPAGEAAAGVAVGAGQGS